MRAFCSILLLVFSFGSFCRSQDPIGPGFLNVLNLVSLETPTYLSISSFKFREGESVYAGSETGFIALKPGTYPFKIVNEGAEPEEEVFPVEIKAGKNVIVICFADLEEDEDGSISAELRGTVLTQLLETELPRVSVVSLLQSAETIGRIGRDQVRFPQRRALSRQVELHETINVEVKNVVLEEIDIEKKAHYMVFLFEEPESGAISSSLVVNREFEFQNPDSNEDESESEED